MQKLPFLLFPLLLLLNGCATPSFNPDVITTYINSHNDLITKGVAVFSRLVIAKAEKDPVAREQLKADINSIIDKVARGLDAAAATSSGTLTPDQLAADLKAKDPEVQAGLDAMLSFYQEGYTWLSNQGRVKDALPWVRLALTGFRTLASGLNKATS